MRAESRLPGCLRGAGRFGAMAAALIVLPAVLAAQPQPEHPDRPAHYAIRNALIVPVSAGPIENGTIVLSDGVVAAVGRDVEIPPEAWVIDGEGLTVYPGLIDALSGLGLDGGGAPGGSRAGGGGGPASDGDDGGYSWGPEDRPATTPWRSAAESFDASREEIRRWRDGGFTSVVAVPETGFVSGRASVMNLGRGDADAQVVKTPVAIRLNLEGGPDHEGYPESLMGVFAYFEQLFADAERYDRAWSLYEAGARGRERPEFDSVLEPIRDGVDRDLPFLFPGDDPTEIRRALRTGGEAGFRPLVYGARRAYGEPELLRDSGVLVSLEWPETHENGDPEADPVLSELRYRWYAPSTPAALEGAGVRFAFYSGDLGGPSEVVGAVRKAIRAGLSREAALRALTLAPAEIYGVADRLGSLEPGKTANVVVTDGELFAQDTEVKIVFVDGRKYEVRPSTEVLAGRDGGGEGSAGEGEGTESAWEPVPRAVDRGPYAEADALLIRNATVHTVTEGTLENASVLVRDGTIAAVGADVSAPSGATVLDGRGMHVTPGIIDAHSHIAADAINEGSVAVSSMVGIRDVLDPDDESIYRAAAGGVTTANILHGSANPIGGRNAVIKMRWGADAPDLLFEGAPPGIKFALGENTKRDRDPDRYPATRMGVMDVIRSAFSEARRYRARWAEYERRRAAGENPVPPRRDLKLETLVEVLDGERLVHAHSYRGDEILQLLRVAEEFGVRIATFQHVLEGYKVADELAAHGAGASTFSDWWAYKVEAYDAIPHNAALMAERGVLVSINSDSGEEMRHLNQEAAKAVKWGGMEPGEALKLVTLNPAIQLGIDDRVGSIEPGKDADLVIWDADPLSVYAVARTTIIDGKIYFDREMDRQRQAEIRREKERLREKLGIGGPGEEAVTEGGAVAPPPGGSRGREEGR